METGVLSSTIWSLIISWHLFLKHVKRERNTHKYIVIWMILGHILPFIISTSILESSGFKPIGSQICWINTQDHTLLIPHAAYLVLNLLVQDFFYTRIYLKYRRYPTEFSKRRVMYNLAIYFITYLGFIAYCALKVAEVDVPEEVMHAEILIISLVGILTTLNSNSFKSIRVYLKIKPVKGKNLEEELERVLVVYENK